MNLKYLLISCIMVFTANASFSKLQDKISCVIDSHIFTNSEIRRIKSNLAARKMMSPMIYQKDNLTSKEISQILINTFLVRARIAEMGYVISDEQVESEIKSTEKRLRLTRSALLTFLKENNLTFDEYFELTREAIEYSVFVGKVIRPMISITEQEVKNAYYKKNLGNKTLAFRYTLVDFALPKNKFKKGMLKRFKDVLVDFQSSGILPKEFKDVSTNVLGDISEDDLMPKHKQLLKKTDEGSFSKPLLFNKSYHVYFVKEKNLMESSEFYNVKQQIKNELFQDASNSMISLWMKREGNKHYIKFF